MVVRHLGLLPYLPAWQAMQAYTERRDATAADEIWLLEHPPVFTQGLNGKAHHLLAPGDIPVIPVDRGGQVTYHGPGQLVAYLLVDLRRRGWGVRHMVDLMEQAVIRLLAGYGIDAHARRDAPGVYVEAAKIASLGLRVRRGCCYHGLSLNVSADLEPFTRINPCGYADLAVTRLADRLSPCPNLTQVSAALEAVLLAALDAPSPLCQDTLPDPTGGSTPCP